MDGEIGDPAVGKPRLRAQCQGILPRCAAIGRKSIERDVLDCDQAPPAQLQPGLTRRRLADRFLPANRWDAQRRPEQIGIDQNFAGSVPPVGHHGLQGQVAVQRLAGIQPGGGKLT